MDIWFWPTLLMSHVHFHCCLLAVAHRDWQLSTITASFVCTNAFTFLVQLVYLRVHTYFSRAHSHTHTRKHAHTHVDIHTHSHTH